MSSNYNQNNYLCPPPTCSGGTPVEYNANWGAAPRVMDDPQLAPPDLIVSAVEEQSRSEIRRARRKVLADLAGEFAASHDDLLRDLASSDCQSGGAMSVATPEARAARKVSHERAREAALRLVNSHFNNNRETHPHARMTIPVDVDDDDVVLMDYIHQQEKVTR
jgi:hypothetical protein